MESWPAFEGSSPLSLFVYEIIMDSPGTYSGWRVGFPDGGVIIWGDGNKSVYPQGTGTYFSNHDYESAGIYRIIIFGASSDGMMHDTVKLGQVPPLKRVLTPFPSTTTVSPFQLFNRQSNLEYICPELFSECIITESDASGFCSGCTKLGSIHAQWFERMNLTRLEGAFANVGTELSAPVAIPHGLFDGCTDVTTIDSLFERANVSGDLIGLFDDCASLTRADYAFFGTKIQAIPQDLFANSPNITRFVQTFYSCKDVSGAVPELWVTHPSANGHNCFGDMTPSQITNYSLIPVSWGGPV